MKDAKQGAGTAGKQIMAVSAHTVTDRCSKTCGALVPSVAEKSHESTIVDDLLMVQHTSKRFKNDLTRGMSAWML